MAPEKKAAPDAGKKHICFVCKRKFKTLEQLGKHEDISTFHADNLRKQDETLSSQKGQLYSSLRSSRHQLNDLETLMSRDVLNNHHLSEEKAQVEDRLSRCEVTYGLVQEKIEARRRCDKPVKTEAVEGQTLEMLPGWTLSSSALGWWGNKEVQEDRFILDMVLAGGEVVAYCVLDGHTGSKCVDYVYASLKRTLERTLSNKPRPLVEDFVKQAVKEALVLVEDEWIKLAKAHDLVDGTTCNLVLFFADKTDLNLDGTRQIRKKVICANVGDTRAVISRRGQPLRLSEDHRPGRPSEKLRIEEAGGAVTEVNGIHRVFTLSSVNIHGRMMHLGLSVSRSFGDLPLKQPVLLVDSRPEFRTRELEDDDCVIIACDGVWDVLSEREASLITTDGRDKGAYAAKQIVRRAFEKGSSDNLTVAVIYCDSSEREAKKRRKN